jgi:hypothetical protein
MVHQCRIQENYNYNQHSAAGKDLYKLNLITSRIQLEITTLRSAGRGL